MRKHRLYGFSLAMLAAGGVAVSQWPSVSQDVAAAAGSHHKVAQAANNNSNKKSVKERADFKKARSHVALERRFLTTVHKQQVWEFVATVRNNQKWDFLAALQANQNYADALFAAAVDLDDQQAAAQQAAAQQAAAQQAAAQQAAAQQAAASASASAAPVATSASSGGSSAGSAPSGILSCIAQAESGGDSSAVNPSGAGGTYQIMPSTWAAYGGAQYASVAQDATPAEQTQVAQNILNADGTSPWAGDSCVG